MEAFFKKYPLKFNDMTAIKMIHKKIEESQEKCKKKDPSYMNELAIAYSMLEDFFTEKEVDPSTLL
jgi:hypothetical protein